MGFFGNIELGEQETPFTFNGEKIFHQWFNYGALPSNAWRTYDTSSVGIKQCLTIRGFAFTNSPRTGQTLPLPYTVLNSSSYSISLNYDGTGIAIGTETSFTNSDAWVELFYTKN